MIKSSKHLTIIYIDYNAALKIIKQTTLIISFINKLNLRFVKVLDYVQRHNLTIFHKFEKQYIVFNIFFRLFINSFKIFKTITNFINVFNVFNNDRDLNILNVLLFIDINEIFLQTYHQKLSKKFNLYKNYQNIE